MSAAERLDAIESRAEAATPGPWEADVNEVSQHWSRPEPWESVVSKDVACMAYCYGGRAEGVGKQTDAEFIAAARTDVPALVAAVRAVLAWVEGMKEYAETTRIRGKVPALIGSYVGDYAHALERDIEAALGGERS